MSSYYASVNGKGGDLYVSTDVYDTLKVRFLSHPSTELTLEIDVSDAKEILKKIMEER